MYYEKTTSTRILLKTVGYCGIIRICGNLICMVFMGSSIFTNLHPQRKQILRVSSITESDKLTDPQNYTYPLISKKPEIHENWPAQI